MQKGSPLIVRVMLRKQKLIENQICRRCISTRSAVTPSGKLNSDNSGLQFRITDLNRHRRTIPLAANSRGYADLLTSNPLGTSGDDQKKENKNSPYRSSSSAVPAVPKEQVELNQVETDDDLFKGLETDFPCLARNKTKGPEPSYDNTKTGYKVYKHDKPFRFRHHSGVLPELDIAYETWGELNEAKDNAVLVQCGLSASSHARSHPENPKAGWWEKFVGPGLALDTDKFFVICANNLGSCYGSTGPSSINPLDGKPYATTFPIFGVEDIVSSQFHLLDHLGIKNLYASVGSSLGGMMSITSAVLFPERVGRVVTISACVRSQPSSIAMRYIQRKAIMTDPDWQKGYYYNTDRFPRMGVKLAREIATLTYRSGPEWEQRFGRQRIDEDEEPSLCPHFMIENYLDYQGENAVNKLDPNTLLYISKAMDLFDLGERFGSLHDALGRVACPVMVIGVQTDILFPIWQQREMARILKEAGNETVTFYELNSLYGHDTFLLDLNGVGAGVKGFLETNRN